MASTDRRAVRRAVTEAGAALVVDLAALRDNFRTLSRVAGVETAAVVKADAYGLGATRVVPALRAAGCRTFFVATPSEGMALRSLGTGGEVGVFAGLPDAGPEPGLVPVLNHPGDVERWRDHARRTGASLAASLHVDTGMNRLGLTGAEWKALWADPARLEGIEVRRVISHLACAETPDHPANARQLARFRGALRSAPDGKAASLANSSGIFLGRDYRFSLVRPGAALYGINPTPAEPNPMRSVARLVGRILQVRNVDRGETVGYGAAYRVPSPGRIAVVSVGYADGLFRSLGAGGKVVIRGHPAPVEGRVSMDTVTVDVRNIPEAEEGMLVDVLGPGNDVDAVAGRAGTIGYEVLSRIGSRVPRLYQD